MPKKWGIIKRKAHKWPNVMNDLPNGSWAAAENASPKREKGCYWLMPPSPLMVFSLSVKMVRMVFAALVASTYSWQVNDIKGQMWINDVLQLAACKPAMINKDWHFYVWHSAPQPPPNTQWHNNRFNQLVDFNATLDPHCVIKCLCHLNSIGYLTGKIPIK